MCTCLLPAREPAACCANTLLLLWPWCKGAAAELLLRWCGRCNVPTVKDLQAETNKNVHVQDK
jgi:hypothetical protein